MNMAELVKKIIKNQAIRYVFFGGCTTMVNLVSYAFLRNIAGIDITRSSFISIGLSILFAYAVNKLFVFEKKTDSPAALLKECAHFVGMRLSTMFIETFGVILLSCVWGMNDMYAKLAIQVVVLILNYIFSKFYVFRDKKPDAELTEYELTRKKRKKRCVAWGFAIPALTVFIGFAVNQVFPFGDHGVLIIDSLHQYLPFYTEFHEKLIENQTLLYSFGGGLGFNFWATFAYYLASPLNFLVVLFPKENMMDAMALLIILRIGLCGGTFAYYLTERNKGRNYLPIMFAAMFALGSFIIGYYFNLMWLDSIAMLPLIMMGIERIVKGKDGKLFCISLFYGLFCNYYIGFMLCFFACLYFLVQWISAKEIHAKKVFLSCLRFGWYALLAGGMAAIVLLPAYRALAITESAENSFPLPVKLFVQNLSQLTSQFAFVEPINIADDQIGVNAFCGTLTLIITVLYALDKNIKKRERAAKLLLCGFLLASFNVNILNYIWHGFHVQNGLPNRFAFIYTAMLLVIGFDAFSHIKKLSWKRLFLACMIPIGFTGASMWLDLGERELYVYILTLLLLAAYSVVLLIYNIHGMRNVIFRSIIMGMAIVEMAAYGIYGICMNGTIGRSTYLNDQKAYEAMMERQNDDAFFRSDIDSTRMRNENMFMGADGVVLFSSTMPAATVDLCKALGMEARTNKNGYSGLTKLVNDIFGVKYVVSSTDAENLYQMQQTDHEEPLYLYKNERALSVGFMVDSAIKEWNIDSGDHMEVQNEFVELATGHEPIYYLNQVIEMEDGGTYNIEIPAQQQIYLDVTKAVEKIEITTPEYTKSYDKYNDHLYDLGCFEEETVATVTCTFKEDQEGPIQAKVYVCDNMEYTEVYDSLAENQLETSICTDGKIQGSVYADNAGTLLLSVPYDEGWDIKVDGEESEFYRVGEALTGIDLGEGEHEISMEYTAQGLWEGSLITALCVGLYMVSVLIERKKKQGVVTET